MIHHLENVKSYMSHLQQYRKIITKTFRGISICVIFKPSDMQEYIFSIAYHLIYYMTVPLNKALVRR